MKRMNFTVSQIKTILSENIVYLLNRYSCDHAEMIQNGGYPYSSGQITEILPETFLGVFLYSLAPIAQEMPTPEAKTRISIQEEQMLIVLTGDDLLSFMIDYLLDTDSKLGHDPACCSASAKYRIDPDGIIGVELLFGTDMEVFGMEFV